MDYSYIKEISNKIIASRPDIKTSTLHAYLQNYKKLTEELFDNNFDINDYKYTKKIFNYLNTTYSAKTTIRNYINSIVVLLKAFDGIPVKTIEVYSVRLSNLNEQIQNEYLENKKSPKDKTNWITLQDIQNVMGTLSSKIENEHKNKRRLFDYLQSYLIISLYTKMPPIRNDYANVIVLDKEIEDYKCDYNYIFLEEKVLLLCNYKTNKRYGVKKIEMPTELLTLISDFMKTRENLISITEENKKFLLLNVVDHSKMTKNGLTKYLNKIFYPKKVSTTILRKVYISTKYANMPSIKDMINDQNIMGHGFQMQQMVYRKL